MTRRSPPAKLAAVITDRVGIVEGSLDRFLESASPPSRVLADDGALVSGSSLTRADALRIFHAQLTSRAIDVAARELKGRGLGYYTISSAGHEQNAVVGYRLHTTDPCFLHYRAGAFMMARALHDPSVDAVTDTLLSVCASEDDPIAQGRHKVWGSRPLWVPPQTSTIASHLPKAVGMAFAMARGSRLGMPSELPADSIVCCSFGDASANHATALAGIHAARYGHRRGNPMPILFVCEDNGIGISVDTPARWIADSFGNLPHLHFVDAEGPLDRIWESVEEAIETCRTARAPVFLRLATVRLWGHAGSDIETAYRSVAQIESAEARDPILLNAGRLLELGAATPAELSAMRAEVRERVARAAEEAAGRRHLSSAAAVMAPLAPYDAARTLESSEGAPSPERRREVWGDEPPETWTTPVKRTMAAQINAAMVDEMARRPELTVFGEDVGRKGGVYYVTAGLQKRFGSARVFDTQLDETSILGLAQGFGMAGFLPVPEIQYLAYVHNALDQIRGEACSLSFFSNGQFQNPMVVRIASFAYQRGFGGHFHNDPSIGGLRDIPGFALVVPSRGDDAARLLRGALAMASVSGRVVGFLEPIALYHEKDLYAPGDEGWLFDYPPPGSALLPGDVGVYGSGRQTLVITYGNGVRLSLIGARMARQPEEDVRIVDLRWINPLPFAAIEAHAQACARVLVVDECRATGGGIADAVVAHLAERGYAGRLASVRALDTYVPLGPAANTVLVQPETIAAALDGLAAARDS